MTAYNAHVVWLPEARTRAPAPVRDSVLRQLALAYARPADPMPLRQANRKARIEHQKREVVISDYASLVDQVALGLFPEMHLSRRLMRLNCTLHKADLEAQTYFDERNRVTLERDKARAAQAAVDAQLQGVKTVLDAAQVPVKLAGMPLSPAGRVQWLVDKWREASTEPVKKPATTA